MKISSQNAWLVDEEVSGNLELHIVQNVRLAIFATNFFIYDL